MTKLAFSLPAVDEEAQYFLVEHLDDDLGLLYTHKKQLCSGFIGDHGFWPQKPTITVDHIMVGLRSDWMPRNAVPVIYTCNIIDFNTIIAATDKFSLKQFYEPRWTPHPNYRTIKLGSIFNPTEIHKLLEHVRLRDTLLELNT